MNRRPLEELEAQARGMVAGFLGKVEEYGRELLKGYVRAHTRGKSEVHGYVRADHPGAAVEPGLPLATPEEREENIDRVELSIRDLPYEVFIGLDSNGNPAWAEHGGAYSVSIPPPQQAAMAQVHLGVFTHNHPSDNSFSPDDVRVACRIQVKELRVVGARYRHSLRLAHGRFTPALWTDVLAGLVKGMEDRTWSIQQSAINRGELTTPQGNAVFHHLVWGEVANAFPGLVYERTEWPDRKEKAGSSDAAA